MFFRRERLRTPAFEERLNNLRNMGYAITPRADGVLRVSRGKCAVELKEADGDAQIVGRAGLVRGDEMGALIDGGYQKFFRTPSGKTWPALAEDLVEIHNFEEDLKEALGRESFYNESLGTVSVFYLYDRVQDRDRGVPKRVWEK